MVVADKADASRERAAWLEERGIHNGILRKGVRGQALGEPGERMNKFLSSVRCGIEKIFGWWKRCTGYRRVRYVGWAGNRLELEFKCMCWNLKRLASLSCALRQPEIAATSSPRPSNSAPRNDFK